MQEQVAIQRVLLTKYEELKSKNPHFSRRAFSQKLGLSAGSVCELLNGQRKISIKLAERIAQNLSLDPQERAELFKLFPEKALRSKESDDSSKPNYLRLSADQFRVIGEWYHFAILTLMRTRDFKSDIAWIAERFGLSLAVVKSAVERMKRLDIIHQDHVGNMTRSKMRYRTSDDVSNASVRLAHNDCLENARKALETLPVEERDFSALMLTFSPEQLPRAKELIRKFQDDFAAEMEAGASTEVYQLYVQLFPLTKVRKEPGETK